LCDSPIDRDVGGALMQAKKHTPGNHTVSTPPIKRGIKPKNPFDFPLFMYPLQTFLSLGINTALVLVIFHA
jgi:hypothetical protein